LNNTGGISVDDPAIDLAVVAIYYPQMKAFLLTKIFCFAGEVGLSGDTSCKQGESAHSRS
jgi:DNA repair protein RadA/Sms